MTIVVIPVRVVSYNVHSLSDDRQALSSVVRGLDPDVVVVQEAPRRLRWRSKCAALARSFGLVVASGGLPSLGNLILVSHRVAVTESWCLQYPLTPGRHMRGAAFARCVVPGSVPFVVAGSHLSTNDIERPGQAALLKPALDSAGAPVVLGIDLNETDPGPSYTILAGGLSDLGGTALTFPAAAPDRRIDFLFADKRLALKAFRVESSPQTTAASDHLPIIADLGVPAV